MSLSAGTRLDRTVAVKVLPADVASTQSHASVSQKAVARKPERSERFERSNDSNDSNDSNAPDD
ncbi:MAG TPA: hypothetical protein VIK60_18495 [Vicinamibacterales bacterium]